MDAESIKRFKDEYDSKKEDHSKYLDFLKTKIYKLLIELKIRPAFEIQTRVKTWESIKSKLYKENHNFQNVSEMQDICGLRIVLLFKKECTTVINSLKNFLGVIRDYETSSRLKDNAFGYQATHIIAKIPTDWDLLFDDMKGYEDLLVELQIRTLAQHLWAEASNQLQYKNEQSVPPNVKRSLSRAAAILELIDIEFERTTKQKENYIEGINLETNQPLDADVLEKLLDLKLPKKNKINSEDYSDLVKDLGLINIYTTQNLVKLIERHLEFVLIKEKEYAKVMRKNIEMGYVMTGTTENRIRKNIYFSHTGLLRSIISKEAGNEWFFIK